MDLGLGCWLVGFCAQSATKGYIRSTEIIGIRAVGSWDEEKMVTYINYVNIRTGTELTFSFSKWSV